MALIALHHYTAELTYYIWYAIYIVLGFAAAIAFVPELVACKSGAQNNNSKRLSSKYTPVLVAIILIVGYGWMVSPSLLRLRKYERHTMKEAVEVARGESPALDPKNAKVLTCVIGSGANQMSTYDPWVKPVKE